MDDRANRRNKIKQCFQSLNVYHDFGLQIRRIKIDICFCNFLDFQPIFVAKATEYNLRFGS